jgi:hypothetical protein
MERAFWPAPERLAARTPASLVEGLRTCLPETT